MFRSLGQHHVNAQASTREGSYNLVSDIRFKRLHFPLVHFVENSDLRYESINVREEKEHSDSLSHDATFTFAQTIQRESARSYKFDF